MDTCTADGCTAPATRRIGLCERHYRARRRASSALCSVTGCPEPALARGMCSTHYARWLRHGDPEYVIVRALPQDCSIDACERPVLARDMCSLHYHRWLRRGHPQPEVTVRQARGEACAVEGCDRAVKASGYCVMHYARVRKHGDPSTVLPSSWERGVTTYGGLHKRIVRSRGRAADYGPCVDCGGPAKEWSYDHTDPAEVLLPAASTRPAELYPCSLNVMHYEPRCHTCHTRFDAQRKRSERKSS